MLEDSFDSTATMEGDETEASGDLDFFAQMEADVLRADKKERINNNNRADKVPAQRSAGDSNLEEEDDLNSLPSTSSSTSLSHQYTSPVQRDGHRLKNLFEMAIQSPSTMKGFAKQAAILIGKYKFDGMNNLNVVQCLFLDTLTNAIMGRTPTGGCMPSGVIDVIFRLCAYIDVLETQLGKGHNAALAMISETFETASHSREDAVRARACRFMGEVLSMEATAKEGDEEVEEEEEEEMTSQTSSVKTNSTFNLSDEDVDMDDTVVTQSTIRRQISDKVVDERMFRTITWTQVLERMRMDKSVEVRCEVVTAMGRLPHLKAIKKNRNNKAYPDKLVMESLNDVSVDVRVRAAEAFAFTSPGVIDKAIDALEVETENAVRIRLVHRLLKDVNVWSYTEKQRNRLIDVVYADADGSNALSGSAGARFIPQWMREMEETEGKLLITTVLQIVDPVKRIDVAEKAVLAAISACRLEDVGAHSSDIIDWVRHLSGVSEASGSGPTDCVLLRKEAIVPSITGTRFEEIPELCPRIFLYRIILQYCLKECVNQSERDEIAYRMLPTLYEFSSAVKAFVESIARDPSQLSSTSSQSSFVQYQEFAVTELCKLIRFVDRTDPVGRKAWRDLLTVIIKESVVVRNKELLEDVMVDLVDNTTDNKEEADEVISELTYTVHALLMVDPEMHEGEEEQIVKENIPRCAVLLESILRNSSVNTYSPVLKNLVMKLVEVATASDEVRAVGCRIIGLAACMDKFVFLTYAHILTVLPTTMKEEKQTKIACLTSLAELAHVHGLPKLCSIIYMDLKPVDENLEEEKEDDDDDDDMREDEEDEPVRSYSGSPPAGSSMKEKIKCLVGLFEDLIMDKDPDVSFAAITQGLRMMYNSWALWAELMGKAIAAVHLNTSLPLAKAAVESFVSHEIKLDVLESRMFLVAAVTVSIQWYEREQDSVRLNFSAMLNYVFEKIRDEQAAIPSFKVKREIVEGEIEQMVVNRRDFVAEFTLMLVCLQHMRTHSDSDICGPLAVFLGTMPIYRMKDHVERLRVLQSKLKTAITRLQVHDQKDALHALAKFRTKLEKLLEPAMGKNPFKLGRKRLHPSTSGTGDGCSSMAHPKVRFTEPKIDLDAIPRIKREMSCSRDVTVPSQSKPSTVTPRPSQRAHKPWSPRKEVKKEVVSQMPSTQCYSLRSHSVSQLRVKQEVTEMEEENEDDEIQKADDKIQKAHEEKDPYRFTDEEEESQPSSSADVQSDRDLFDD